MNLKEKMLYSIDGREWLHELTLLGYEQEPPLIIQAQHEDFIEDCFNKGKTVQETVELYKNKIKPNLK